MQEEDLRPGLLQVRAGLPPRAWDPLRRLMLRLLVSDHSHTLLLAALGHPAVLLAAPAGTLSLCLTALGHLLGQPGGLSTTMRARAAEAVLVLESLLQMEGVGLGEAAAGACLAAAVPASGSADSGSVADGGRRGRSRGSGAGAVQRGRHEGQVSSQGRAVMVQ